MGTGFEDTALDDSVSDHRDIDLRSAREWQHLLVHLRTAHIDQIDPLAQGLRIDGTGTDCLQILLALETAPAGAGAVNGL